MKLQRVHAVLQVLALIAGLNIFYGIIFLSINVLNADFYSRLNSIVTINSPSGKPDLPTVRLVLHQVLTEENAVEASLLIYADGTVADDIALGRATLTATARDVSVMEPYAMKYAVTLDAKAADRTPGVSSVAVRSDRFRLLASSSVLGFPFDNLSVRPAIDLYKSGHFTSEFQLEAQKTVPGRLMKFHKDGGITTVTLARSQLEKTMVLSSSAVFVLLSVILGYKLLTTRENLSTLEELLAVAGYIVAAAGFREITGVSRAVGTSALEVGAIGLPLVGLTLCATISILRRQSQQGQFR